ncbi:MAG: hypothetical protein HQ574_07185, partial [Chloroflexi bacterium]|nr:hypothetical protein [Chloroflexota bacterium]
KINTVDRQLVFTVALLKDIGKVVLSQYVGDSFEEILALAPMDLDAQLIALDEMAAELWEYNKE